MSPFQKPTKIFPIARSTSSTSANVHGVRPLGGTKQDIEAIQKTRPLSTTSRSSDGTASSTPQSNDNNPINLPTFRFNRSFTSSSSSIELPLRHISKELSSPISIISSDIIPEEEMSSDYPNSPSPVSPISIQSTNSAQVTTSTNAVLGQSLWTINSYNTAYGLSQYSSRFVEPSRHKSSWSGISTPNLVNATEPPQHKSLMSLANPPKEKKDTMSVGSTGSAKSRIKDRLGSLSVPNVFSKLAQRNTAISEDIISERHGSGEVKKHRNGKMPLGRTDRGNVGELRAKFETINNVRKK